jgi:hypothetical protein
VGEKSGRSLTSGGVGFVVGAGIAVAVTQASSAHTHTKQLLCSE